METNNEAVGYVVRCVPSHLAADNFWRLMGYGQPGDPDPDMLLTDRGVTLFKTRDEAFRALNKICKHARETGQTWINKFIFNVYAVTAAPHDDAERFWG